MIKMLHTSLFTSSNEVFAYYVSYTVIMLINLPTNAKFGGWMAAVAVVSVVVVMMCVCVGGGGNTR